MELIDKAAVVAEITNLKVKYDCGWNCAIDKVLEHIDDLEVKEVDFETAFAASVDHFDKKNNYGRWSESDLRQFAEHFFKLGLKAQKGE